MIHFEDFGEHKLDDIKQSKIYDALIGCMNEGSFFCILNMIYNNSDHFFNPSYSYDTWQFLTEIAVIAASPIDTLTILGGVHSCSGHQSALFPKNTLVSDYYIRFTIKLHKFKRLHVLNESQVFHFLVDVPEILI